MGEVVGIRRISFMGREGNLVTGVSIYVNDTRDDVEGIYCQAESIYGPNVQIPSIGDRIAFYFNKAGKCRGWVPAAG